LFIVAPDGHPRIPRIIYAIPTGYFEASIRDNVMRSVFLPARINGVPTSSPFSMFYNFKMNSVTIHDYGDLEHRVAKTKLEAEAGEPSAQMLYGMMISGLPQLIQTRDRASRGDHRAAVKAETKAIDEAGRLGWDLTPLQQCQAIYASEKAWSGNLLDF
jgi:hypothetical protein